MPSQPRRLVAALTAPVALAGLPAVAAAHGISGAATNKPTIEYIPLGIEHMLLGWDHLLFVLGIVLLAGQPKRAAKLISLFVAGHSITLIAGTIFEWRVSPTAVDAVIALSVVFVAGLGLRGRPDDWFWPGMIIFGFGLIHGLGLATRLQDLGIPDAGLVGKTIAFNIGIEIGQLLAVAFMMAVVWTFANHVPRWPAVRRAAYAVIAVAGAVAATLLLAGVGSDETAIAGSTTSCETRQSTSRGDAGGRHPDKEFFEPRETALEANLGHVRGDGFVIVRYRPDLAAGQLEQLRGWIEGNEKALIGAPDPAQAEPIVAKTARTVVTCDRYDFAAVKRFADERFAERRRASTG